MKNVRYFRQEWRMIRRVRPDVLLVRYDMQNFSAVAAAALKGIPIVLEVNAPQAYESRQFGEVAYLPFVPEVIERWNMRMATRIYVVSDVLRAYLQQWGIPSQKMIVIPNGADEERFHPGVSGRRIREQYGLQEKVVIGFIGSFHYWHGVENLMPLIDTVGSLYGDVAFFLVGMGPLKEELERKLEDRDLTDRVVFSGYVPHDEMPEVVAAMDVVLAPYPKLALFYYSPLKIFEYLASGKAVVASRVGQIEEIIQDFMNGMLYDPDDIDALMEKVCILIENDDLRHAMGAKARETVLTFYTWRKTARRVSDVLDSASSTCFVETE
jgi:glycosyltransferase involved in cell wall biosynthesis